MLLLYLKNGKCKISIIVPVFIAEEIFLGCHLGWQRKQRCCLFMKWWQPRTYLFSDEYYCTYNHASHDCGLNCNVTKPAVDAHRLLQLAEIAGRKKSPKNRCLCTIVQLCWAISSQLRHLLTIIKKLVKQQYLLQLISTGFMSWQHYCTALQ